MKSFSVWPRSNPALQHLAKRTLARRRLHSFVQYLWPVVEPHTNFIDNWHIQLICTKLESITRGECTRLVINVPPRCMKSLLVTVMWPCWEWLHTPGNRYLCASYSEGVAEDHSMARRAIIESARYQALCKDRIQISARRNRKNDIGNSELGRMMAVGVGGSATGRGGNRILIDDPMDPRQAWSQLERENANRWFSQTISTRLDDPKRGAVVIVMQRLHEQDTTGLALEQGYQHLCFPMEYDGRSSAGDPRKKTGELLWQQRFDAHTIQMLKVALGSYGVAGQLQQTPAPQGGGMVKREWLKYYQYLDGRVHFLQKYVTVDLATSERELADYTAAIVWGLHRQTRKLYLLDAFHERKSSPDVTRALLALNAKWQPTAFHIESVGFQLSMIQHLQLAGLPIRRLKVQHDKATRLSAALPYIESGDVLFPFQAPWMVDLERELLAFPVAAHDDFVDAFAYGVNLGMRELLYPPPVQIR